MMYHDLVESRRGRLEDVALDASGFKYTASEISRRNEDYDATVMDLVLKLVSTLERVSIEDLTNSMRGKMDVSLARQMAIYLVHTVFSVPYLRIAALLNRDRTTISYACRIVEDLRDNEEFDKRLEAMENLLVTARTLCAIADRYQDEQ